LSSPSPQFGPIGAAAGADAIPDAGDPLVDSGFKGFVGGRESHLCPQLYRSKALLCNVSAKSYRTDKAPLHEAAHGVLFVLNVHPKFIPPMSSEIGSPFVWDFWLAVDQGFRPNAPNLVKHKELKPVNQAGPRTHHILEGGNAKDPAAVTLRIRQAGQPAGSSAGTTSSAGTATPTSGGSQIYILLLFVLYHVL
jgi:hypothetical protein